MLIRQNAVFIAAVAVCFVSLVRVAHATCPTTCVHSTDFWQVGTTSGSDNVVLGMWSVPMVGWVPAACVNGVPHADPNYVYASRQLNADTSLCLGGGNDTFEVIPFGSTYMCNGNVFSGFDDNGYELTVSAESGNDTVSLCCGMYDGATSICGSTGDDTLSGGSAHDYIAAGGGDDWIVGYGGDDNLRGGDDDDIVIHDGQGTDYLRGEDGNDCFSIEDGASVESSSSCGSGTDHVDSPDYLGITSCESVASCAP